MPSKPDANFIWSIANLLRGPYKPKEYGDVVLPMTILRRLDCVLAATKDAVLSEQKRSGDRTAKDLLDVKLRKAAKYSFYNTSPYTLPSLTGDSANIKANLLSYVDGFSDNVRDVFTRFGFEEQVQRLEEANALYLVVQEFAKLDLRPQHVSNTEMGSVFEELIRKFAEASNETAGEHFTPREVIALMVDLLLVGDEDATTPGKASSGNASKIQKVSAWVLTANQTIVPTSSLASATAPASRSASASWTRSSSSSNASCRPPGRTVQRRLRRAGARHQPAHPRTTSPCGAQPHSARLRPTASHRTSSAPLGNHGPHLRRDRATGRLRERRDSALPPAQGATPFLTYRHACSRCPSARFEPPLSTSRRRTCVAPGRPTRHARSTGHVTCPGFPDGRGWMAVMSLRSRRGGQQTRSGSTGMSREGGQVKAAEAGRRGSVGHVEVFRMDGVGTSAVGRPQRLSADRRSRPTYTLIWEEPARRRTCGGRLRRRTSPSRPSALRLGAPRRTSSGTETVQSNVGVRRNRTSSAPGTARKIAADRRRRTMLARSPV